MAKKNDELTVEQELSRLHRQIFDFARNPKDDDTLWPTLERMYNDLVAENLRLRIQIGDNNVAYKNLTKKWLGCEKALELCVERLEASQPPDGGTTSQVIKLAKDTLMYKEEK